MEDAVRECVALFNSGYNCAESVFLQACRHMGLEDPLIPKVATAFGGGFCRSKSVCGALSGGVLALSVKYGRTLPQDDRLTLTAKVQSLVREFKEAFGTDNCHVMTGVDFDVPEEFERYKAESHNGVCTKAVEFCLRKVLGGLEG